MAVLSPSSRLGNRPCFGNFWDESKAPANLSKHGVSFEEAKIVFDNVLAVIFDDEAHSVGEKREIIIGHSQNNRLLLISFTERPNAIRIIK